MRQEHHAHDKWLVWEVMGPGGVKERQIKSSQCEHFTTSGVSTCRKCLGLLRQSHPFRNALVRLRRCGPSRDRRVTLAVSHHQPGRKRIADPTLSDEKADAGNKRGAAAQVHLTSTLERRTEHGEADASKSAIAHMLTEYMKNSRHQGEKSNKRIHGFLCTLRITGGAHMYNFLRANLNLPHERTVRRWTQETQPRPFVPGVHRRNFEIIRDLYKDIMVLKGIEGPVPCLLAEDETAVNAVLRWDSKTDTIVGSCGPLCAQGCSTKKECKARGCGDPHACLFTTDRVCMIVGDNGASFQRLEDFVKSQRVARYLRVLIVNPLHRALPQLPVVLVATCSTFDYQTYLVPQWNEVERLFREVIEPIGLVFHGHSSDGDSRRRRAFMLHGASEVGVRCGIAAEGFTLYSRFDENTGHNIINLDQDYLHNIKKLVNCMQHASRRLLLGPNKFASLECLLGLVNEVPEQDHGIRRSDLVRDGFMAMDVPSALRLCSAKALRTMEEVSLHGWGDRPAIPYLAGSLRMLKLVHTYTSCFLSKNISYWERVENAATVATYLRLWREWVRNSDDLDLNEHYATREASQDAILSCHFIVLLIYLFRDDYPNLDIPFDRCGSDACEDLFSMLGSFVKNKRTYSVFDALQTVRSNLATTTAWAQGLFRKASRNRTRRRVWEEGPGVPPNPRNWPTDDQLAASWEKGRLLAYSWALTDGMRPGSTNPRARPRNRVYPQWWVNPHDFDGRASAPGNEEDVMDQEDEAGGEEVQNNQDDDDHDDDDDSSSDDEDDNVPLGMILQMCLSQPNRNISQTMVVPGTLQRRHKESVLAELAGRGVNVSTDRGLRVRSAHAHGNEIPFNPAEDDWMMSLGSDIAVHCDGNNWIGKVISVKKKNGRRWTKYIRPVCLHEDRQSLGDLYVTCHYYTRVRSVEHGGLLAFKFDGSGPDPVHIHVMEIIGPVQLKYHPSSRLYTLDKAGARILQAQSSGVTSWDPSA